MKELQCPMEGNTVCRQQCLAICERQTHIWRMQIHHTAKYVRVSAFHVMAAIINTIKHPGDENVLNLLTNNINQELQL